MDSNNKSISEKDDVVRVSTGTTSCQQKGGKKAGKLNYKRDELLSLFAIMDRILPISTDEWEQVQIEHSELYPGRDVNSIQRKYMSLYRKQGPIGSPNLTPEIHAAKRIRFKISKKASIGLGDEGDKLASERRSSGRGSRKAPPPPSQDVQDGPAVDIPADILFATSVVEGQQPGPGPGPDPFPVARPSSSAVSSLSVASSCAVRRRHQKYQHEFLELMRMQRMMDREERRLERDERLQELRDEFEERRRERREQYREDRRRHREIMGLLTAVVSGITEAFGLERPHKRRKQRTNNCDTDHSNPDDTSKEST